MTIEVKVPQLPESVADATLVAWHKAAGDAVKRDENLVDLETDKVVLEVPAPASGVLKEIRIEDGTTVTSGEVLAILEEGEVSSAGEAEGGAKDEAQAEPKQPEPEPGVGKTGGAKADAGIEGKSAHKLSPSVRRLVEEHGLDADKIPGSARDGRLTKADVTKYIAARGSAPESVDLTEGERGEKRVPMTRLRARIAERLVEVQQTAAMLTTFNEVDLTEVMALRKRYRDRFEKDFGVRLGFMSFFVKAAVQALRRYPAVNAYVDGAEIVYHDYFDIGIAVSTERGLVVPVLRDADALGFAAIEQGIGDFAVRAREGSLTIEEMTGGTFTITNGGVFGSLLSTPIINPPQSAILGMHKIQERPMVVDGEIRVRPMMYLALTYDHRIIDGRESVQFLVTIKEALEDPARLLLEI